ncbi:hypothetical protein PMI35_00342 [Pseudomonas sp. GM78]|nr:hypothetical protein PMI35_00342 [Pseudomonas sp. GM78]
MLLPRHRLPLLRALRRQPLLLLLPPHLQLPLRLLLRPSLAPRFMQARPYANWPVNSASS